MPALLEACPSRVSTLPRLYRPPLAWPMRGVRRQAQSAEVSESRLLDAVAAELQQARGAFGAPASELASLRAELARLRDALAATRASQTRAWAAAHRDVLTGLPDGRGFETHSARTLSLHASGKRGFGLLFLDCEGAQPTNGRVGRAAGDELLRVVAARLVHALRHSDCISHRGGGEFLCLLPQLPGQRSAAAIARRLLEAVALPCSVDTQTVSVQASIGVATYPRDGVTIGALLGSAGRALARAKASEAGVAMMSPHSPG